MTYPPQTAYAAPPTSPGMWDWLWVIATVLALVLLASAAACAHQLKCEAYQDCPMGTQPTYLDDQCLCVQVVRY